MASQQAAKMLLPSLKRQLAKVLAIEHEQIEHIINKCSALRSSINQPFKTRVAVVIQRNDLSIQNNRPLERSQGFHNHWESFLEILLITTVEADASIVPLGDRSEPI